MADNNNFTDEELGMLSNGLLSLFQMNNNVLQFITDEQCIDRLGELNKKYQELNCKVCKLMKG